MSSAQVHPKANHEEVVEPKKETKAEKAEHETEKVNKDLEAMTAERDILATRIVAFEAFINDALKTASFNSTLATELLKK